MALDENTENMFSAIIDTERGLFKKRFPDEVDSFHSCDDTLLLMNSSKGSNENMELGNRRAYSVSLRRSLDIWIRRRGLCTLRMT